MDLSTVLEVEGGMETREGDAQKLDVALVPELTLGLPRDLRLTVIGRFRADPVDELEPGQPTEPTRAIASERIFVGDAFEAELRELYVDAALGPAFLRVGKQQVVWGQANGLRVLDVVNPLHHREFILPDFEDRRIPLWTLNAEVPLGPVLAQLLWVPDRTYDDVPAADAAFAMTSPRLVPQAPPDVPVQVREPERPNAFVGGSDAGVRLSAFARGWDLTFNYFYHHADRPVLFQSRGSEGVVVTPRYERTHLVGGTFSNAFGAYTVRGELGISSNRYVLTTNPADADGVHRTTEGSSVLGLDYGGFDDTLVSVQLFQSVLADRPDGVVRDRIEHQATLLVQRDFLNRVLRTELLAVQSLNHGDGLVQLDVDYTYRTGVVVTLGADLFYGDRAGLFGQFRARSRVTAGVEVGL